MKIIWKIEDNDVEKVKAFYQSICDDPFVKLRIKTNLRKNKQTITKSKFWQVMVCCLLTTQQRSGPGSPVTRFISATPFALEHVICVAQPRPDQFITNVLIKHGGLRRSTTIGREAQANLEYMEGIGWKETHEVLESVRQKSTPESERLAAKFIADHFQGFGPKQSRNLLQGLGLSRFEIPIDSRITKWLNEFGFPVKLSSGGLSDPYYYEFVSEGFQKLANSCKLYPCVLDAAIFSSFDVGGWTEENAVW